MCVRPRAAEHRKERENKKRAHAVVSLRMGGTTALSALSPRANRRSPDVCVCVCVCCACARARREVYGVGDSMWFDDEYIGSMIGVREGR